MQALKRTQTWPPSQWYLDRFIEPRDSSSLRIYQERSPNQATPSEDYPPATDPTHTSNANVLEKQVTSSQASFAETESVRAASITAIWGTPYPSSSDLSELQPHPTRSRTDLAGLSTVPQKKACFRESHFKRWSRDMSRTSKKVAKHLGLSRRSKDRDRDSSRDHSKDVSMDDSQPSSSTYERQRGRSSSRLRHSLHEMSERSDSSSPMTRRPSPAMPTRRSSAVWDSPGRDPVSGVPRRDLLDLSGGIQAAAGMPHQVRKRHASGKRRASREPEQTLQDIKEEWNVSQVSRDAWAARVRATLSWSPGSLRTRASSDSSVPSSYLTG